MAKNQGATGTFKNAILAKLPPEELDRLRGQLRPVALDVNKVIYEPGQPLEQAYFPEVGMISVVSVMSDGRSIEVGTVGKEGMTGGVLVFEAVTVPFRYFVQLGGNGYQISSERLKEAAHNDSELRRLIVRYEAAFHTQTMQTAACNGLHNIQQRCCRWLLLARDRVETDELHLTHEFLAVMLGVRRASVSEVLHPLQEAGLVRSSRGTITMLDRKGLEAQACECYRIARERELRLNGD